MKDITFAYPEFFYLLLLIPFLIGWYIWRRKQNHPELQVHTIEAFKATNISFRNVMKHGLLVLRVLAFTAAVFALARPQSSSSGKTISTEGIDIVISLDISTSMLAEDLKPNRIEAAKKTAVQFVKNRKNDRIGLVIFAAESFTQCPVTSNHSELINLTNAIKTGMVDDGTAIGNGLATAVSRLKDSKAKSRVIVLLTDGENNTGFIAPLTAADMAKTFGIRVYTIGVGTRGVAPYPFKTAYGTQYQNVEVRIDEELMKKIATITGGQYFRATNTKGLEKIYEEIDQMEKTKIDVMHFTRKGEEFLPFALLALGFIGIELILRYTYLRSIP